MEQDLNTIRQYHLVSCQLLDSNSTQISRDFFPLTLPSNLRNILNALNFSHPGLSFEILLLPLASVNMVKVGRGQQAPQRMSEPLITENLGLSHTRANFSSAA